MRNQKIIFVTGAGEQLDTIILAEGKVAEQIVQYDFAALIELGIEVPSQPGIFTWVGKISESEHGHPPEAKRKLIRKTRANEIQHLFDRA
ncbi:MAG: hypothetical protein BRD31_03850, partial [Bacteroidetes bacterium QH_2_64_26]